ncbi:MAG TPA: lysylphosphatidylglycerol synthase transmembrane domain-containing protein [Candidatus Saccharimonadales bacterium]|nr:lysylphosphatidylglycerol synthase transmembrane domain-containing protein [Candidatus Saccharimonadales bacterium]
MQKRRPTRSSQLVLRIGLVVVLALVLYVVVPQFSGLHGTWQLLAGAQKSLVGVSLVLLLLTFVAGALNYMLLAFYPLRFVPTLVVQLAGGLAGKLLPAGLGNLSLSTAYLHRHQHSLPQAAAVAGTNNLLGFVGYLIDLVLAAGFFGLHAQRAAVPVRLLAIGAAVVIVGGFMAYYLLRKRLASWIKQTLAALRNGLRLYRRQPWRLVASLLVCMSMPVLFSAILWCCTRALGFSLSPIAAFAVFSAGMALVTVTPTPGGIGGAEAGLTAALVVYGYASQDALLVALLYRFITYWLPMIPGGFALAFGKKLYLPPRA